MKKAIIIIGAGAIFLAAYFGWSEDNRVEGESTVSNSVVSSSEKINISEPVVTQKRPLNIFEEIASDDVEFVWEDEYGCFDVNTEITGSCDYEFLNAKSVEEAQWMKRQGYPSRQMLDLALDVTKKEEFERLLDNNYPPALAVATIHALRSGDSERASQLALSFRAYSNRSDSFPYRLYGEALQNSGDRLSASINFQVAGILGDSDSYATAIGLAEGDTIFSQYTTSRAYEVISNTFNTSLNELPKDPRPDGFGGG